MHWEHADPQIDSDVFYPEKQQYWHDGVAIKRDYMILDDYDVKPGDTVYVQDKGTQVSYRLVSYSFSSFFSNSRKF